MKILTKIFNIENENCHVVITILGIKIKLASNYLKLKNDLYNIRNQVNITANELSKLEKIQFENFIVKEEYDKSITITQELNSHNYFKYNNIEILPFCHIQKGVNIGDYSYINSNSKLDLGVKIGKYCSVSSNVYIGATMHRQNWGSTSPHVYDSIIKPESSRKQWLIYQNTEIGNDVWIGTHVVIKTGVKVGHGAIIGSGAIVTKDVPPYAIVVGVPAKIIRYRFSDEIISKLIKSEWWNLSHEKIINLPFDDVEELINEFDVIK